MRRNFYRLLLAVTTLVVMACNEGVKEAETAASTEEKDKIDASAIKVNPAHGLPGHRCDLPVGAPLDASAEETPNPSPVSQMPATSVSPIRIDQTPDVNPPHGQPGHDCSVPVGAKLE